MNGVKLLADTNVIIYHLAGDKNIETLLDGALVYISSITFTELLAGNISEEDSHILNEYLKSVHIVHTNEFICETAATVRKNHKIKLPDALIAATGMFLDLPLISFDSDFEKISNLKIIKLTI
jgi:predicted nucleic acid-binding protein